MILNGDCYELLKDIESKSVDLILIDPPYLISKKSGFSNSKNKKFANHSIDFGEWDKEELNWDDLMKEYYRILKQFGTIIIFYDVWKLNEIRESAEKVKFKQPRVGVWQKSNPVPINSKKNYLSNASEYFVSFVKIKNPTFNSKYDNAIYKYPLCHGFERYDHPTQKPLSLIKELIEKHSNEGDKVLDSFAGSGTTGEACILSNREYILIEKDENYIEIINKRLNKYKNIKK